MKLNGMNGLLATLSVYSMALLPIAALALLIKTLVFGVKVKTVTKVTNVAVDKDN